MEIPKNRGELYNDVNIASPKIGKRRKLKKKWKFKKKNRVLRDVIMKAHAKFQEASSIGITQKSRRTQGSDEDHCPYYDQNLGSKSQI